AHAFLPVLEERGRPVVNGSAASRLETSKAEQLLLLDALGIRTPRARVVTDARRIADASVGLRFPVIVKPNVGGSGALMRRFDSPDELRDAAAAIDLGPGGAGLVQEYLAVTAGSIVRADSVDVERLYANRVSNH